MNTKKKFYVDESRRLVKAECQNDPMVAYWIKHKLHQNRIKNLDNFVDSSVIKSSNPLFKVTAHCDANDEFDEKSGKRIAALSSDYKRNNYVLKQLNRMIDNMYEAIDVLVDYRYELMKKQQMIDSELREYK